MSLNIPEASFNLDGTVTFMGETMTRLEYESLLDQMIQDHVDELKDLRDPTSDLQNLWGKKKDAFRDDVYHRTRPLRRPTGSSIEISDQDWRP